MASPARRGARQAAEPRTPLTRDRVLQAIQSKVDGQEITSEPEEKAPTKIIDLMEALKASLAKGGGEDEKAAAKPAKKKARKAS